MSLKNFFRKDKSEASQKGINALLKYPSFFHDKNKIHFLSHNDDGDSNLFNDSGEGDENRTINMEDD